MVKIINIFGDEYSGQAGKAGVFAKWKGRQYRRKYVIPSNPKTTMQQVVRNHFSNAIDKWHILHSLQRLAYSYLATGLVMSGFNLMVKRWQQAACSGEETPIDPIMGIKQVASDSTTRQELNPVPTAHAFSLGYSPVKIGSLTFTPDGADETMDAYIDLAMGDVRIPLAITKTDGAKDLGSAIAAGDKLVISYTAGGRTVTREVLYTVPGGESSIPAAATIAAALRTAYRPIDFGSVVIETLDISEGDGVYTQLESLEIDHINGAVYYDMTDAAVATSHVDYDDVVPVEDAKLEITKVDTSFITWRRYSDEYGDIPVSQTVEDETYDFVLSASGYESVIRAAQSAVLAAGHECIELTAT